VCGSIKDYILNCNRHWKCSFLMCLFAWEFAELSWDSSDMEKLRLRIKFWQVNYVFYGKNCFLLVVCLFGNLMKRVWYVSVTWLPQHTRKSNWDYVQNFARNTRWEGSLSRLPARGRVNNKHDETNKNFDQCPWQANSSSHSKFPSTLYTPTLHYRAHNSSPKVTFLHSTPHIFCI
jgi:hypothetical protein